VIVCWPWNDCFVWEEDFWLPHLHINKPPPQSNPLRINHRILRVMLEIPWDIPVRYPTRQLFPRLSGWLQKFDFFRFFRDAQTSRTRKNFDWFKITQDQLTIE
jgi:hypothetical protein